MKKSELAFVAFVISFPFIIAIAFAPAHFLSRVECVIGTADDTAACATP